MKRARATGSENSARYLIWGGTALLIFLCGVFAWAAVAPLESAAVASGKVSVENRRKVVQHFDGGIVFAIHVQEGVTVAKGAPLVTLQSTEVGATHRLLRQRLVRLQARRARLIAETAGMQNLVFPSDLRRQAIRVDVERELRIEDAIFRTRRSHIDSQTAVLVNQANAARREIVTLERQIDWFGRQQDLIASEIKDVKKLLDKGLARRPRYLALKRADANISARREFFRGQIERARARTEEANLRSEALRTERRNLAAGELRPVDDQIAHIRERLIAAGQELARKVVTSPVDGAVVNLRLSTVGGVIKPGEPLMDIVPRDEHLLVEAKVRPSDIDIVRAGQTARIRMTVFDDRTTPVQFGKVLSISTDRLQDEVSGGSFYLARIALSGEAETTGKLTAGMPVEVLINSGSQTLLDYLLRPLISSFDRSMREG